jgi:hypothetical protein
MPLRCIRVPFEQQAFFKVVANPPFSTTLPAMSELI